MGYRKLLVLVLFMVAFSGAAYAQVCNGTLSAPTEQVFVGSEFNVSYFNGEADSDGDTLTLYLPVEIDLVSGVNPVLNVSNFTAYTWLVNSSVAGVFDVNVTLEGGVNCSISVPSVVLENATSPLIVPQISDLGTITVNQLVGFDLNLTNFGGNATNVSGLVSSASGSTISPMDFSYALIENSTVVSNSFNMTPSVCGVDSVTAFVNNVHDANGYDSAPVQVTDMFTVEGSDVAFTLVGAQDVLQGVDSELSFTVENIGLMNATGVQVHVLVGGSSVANVALGDLLIGESASGIYNYTTVSAGTNTVTFRVGSDIECSSDDNEINTTFDVTAGLFCGNGVVDAGEQCDGADLNAQTCSGRGFSSGTLACAVTCTFDTSSCTSGSSGSGGGSGGSSGSSGRSTYVLVLTADEPSKTFNLRSGDTVKYSHDGEDYSFLFRYVYADRVKMGVSRDSDYKGYTFNEDTTYNLNLDDEQGPEISIMPSLLHMGKGDFTFSLLDVPAPRPIITLPVMSRNVEDTSASADLESPADNEHIADEEVVSEGMLEFIEDFTVRSKAPLWAGTGLALLIVLLGVGLYLFLTRK